MELVVPPAILWLVGLSVFALCLWLRLDQIVAQVVTDDEWHALQQVISHSPRDFLLSFGVADHSIPLTLLFWQEADWFGLSELAMRWPMMLAGLATVVLLPLWALPRVGWRTALVFALLLAVSPLLINYSRFARPYALTLLLGYLVHYAFSRFWTQAENGRAAGALYVLGSAFTVWLHLISAPFVVAPLVTAAVQSAGAWRLGDRARMKRLIALGSLTALAITVLVLPPFLADPGALLDKSGRNAPDLDTFKGIWHIWLGTPSKPAVLICLGLATFGFLPMYRQCALVRSALVGLGLTLTLILVSRPAWIQVPLVLAGYMLPTIVLLLLAVAVGTTRLATLVEKRIGSTAGLLILTLPMAVLLPRSPLMETMRQPNSYTLHSAFQTDYRTHRDGVKEFMRDNIPLSPWWQTLHTSNSQSAIAVAPYQFVSHLWDAPRWEELSGRRVLPGLLTGLCVDRRQGEAPREPRFKLRNTVYLGDDASMVARGIDYVVFQKPFEVVIAGNRSTVGAETEHCLNALRARFGAPEYEDDKIVAFPVNTTAAAVSHAR
jgi:hypothetical protein